MQAIIIIYRVQKIQKIHVQNKFSPDMFFILLRKWKRYRFDKELKMNFIYFSTTRIQLPVQINLFDVKRHASNLKKFGKCLHEVFLLENLPNYHLARGSAIVVFSCYEYSQSLTSNIEYKGWHCIDDFQPCSVMFCWYSLRR